MLKDEFAPPKPSGLRLRSNSHTSGASPPPRKRSVSGIVGVLAAVLLTVVFLGCMSLSFGERTVVESKTQPDVLEQEGTMPFRGGAEQDVYYPIPYSHPPNLVVDAFSCEVVEQKEDHFRVKFSHHGVDGRSVPWKARGVRYVPPAPVIPVPAPPPGLPPAPGPVLPPSGAPEQKS
jgi:hypothetical protein